MPGLGCQTLADVTELLGDCHRCSLACTRTRIVFGVGDAHARVMLIGEAPGRNEDLRGEPFVGAAGKLLDELLAHSGLERADVYIANVLKCRPPRNRNPEPLEIETCTPFLREQIRVISPRVLVTLGNFATRFVLHTDAPISGLRGTIRQAGRYRVLPIYHPAAAIYDRTKRDVLFADFGLLKTVLAESPDSPLPAPTEEPAPAPDAARPADVIPDPGPSACDGPGQEALF